MKPITEQEKKDLIGHCKDLKGRIEKYGHNRREFESKTLQLVEIALASLPAVPVAYVTYKGYLLHAGDPSVSEYSDPEPLYTAPPVPVIKLPDDHKIDGVGSLAYASGYEDGHKEAIELVKRINGIK